MQNRMMVVAVVLTTICESALGLVRVCHVDPVKASWGGWTRREDALSQVVTCNFDSLVYVELFAGDPGSTGSGYRVGVLGDGVELAYATGVQHQPTSWVRFDNWNTEVAFTKGKQYEFRFTRGRGDSIQYYYHGESPYQYGHMRVGSTDEPAKDLCARVYGRMNALDSNWLSVQIHSFGADPLETALTLAKDSLGVTWVGDDLGQWDSWASNPDEVVRRCTSHMNMGFHVRGYLAYGNDNATVSSRGHGSGDTFPRATYAPRNLFAPLTDDTNYWSGYCKSIMGRLPDVEYWAVWGEPNAGWNWHDPDIAYYHGSGGANDPIDTPRERCSLYVRMCHIAKQAALALDHGQKVIGGYVWRVLDGGVDLSTGDTIVAPGKTWLRHMFDLAERPCFGGVESCFDVVGVDPYMHHVELRKDRLWFDEGMFEADLDTARAVMRAAGHADMALWVMEMGWPRWRYQGDSTNPPRPLTDTLMQARNLCQFLVSAQARRTDPRGGYDRVNWYELTSYRGSHRGDFATEGFGLLDTGTSYKPLSQWWSAKQVVGRLVGKRCNGRTMTEDTRDNAARLYEFEDTATLRRTWVCWKDGDTKRDVDVRLPVRTNSLDAESLAYTRSPPTFSPRVGDDGWLRLTLNTRPVFIGENAAPMRPDLRVDSVQYVRASRVVRAWITNHGTRATPSRSGSRVPYPTWVVLTANGDSLAQNVRVTSIAVNQQVEFTFDLGQAKLTDTVLFSVTVNPNQTYVELGTDDNTGYALAVKP